MQKLELRMQADYNVCMADKDLEKILIEYEVNNIYDLARKLKEKIMKGLGY